MRFCLRTSAALLILLFSFENFSITSLAGTLQPVGDTWAYQNDDGTLAVNNWVVYQGENYYFDSNGLMLRNTLAPDGSPLGRDGRLLVNRELMPQVFSGSEEEYSVFLNTYRDYLYGYDKTFNDFYDSIYVNVLKVGKSKNFTDAWNAISLLDSFNFDPFRNSDNIAVRKTAVYSDIFRIEQVYLLSEFVRAEERHDIDYTLVLFDKLLVSIDNYGYSQDAIIDAVNAFGGY